MVEMPEETVVYFHSSIVENSTTPVPRMAFLRNGVPRPLIFERTGIGVFAMIKD